MVTKMRCLSPGDKTICVPDPWDSYSTMQLHLDTLSRLSKPCCVVASDWTNSQKRSKEMPSPSPDTPIFWRMSLHPWGELAVCWKQDGVVVLIKCRHTEYT